MGPVRVWRGVACLMVRRVASILKGFLLHLCVLAFTSVGVIYILYRQILENLLEVW